MYFPKCNFFFVKMYFSRCISQNVYQPVKLGEKLSEAFKCIGGNRNVFSKMYFSKCIWGELQSLFPAQWATNRSKCIFQNVFLKMNFSKCISQNVFQQQHQLICFLQSGRSPTQALGQSRPALRPGAWLIFSYSMSSFLLLLSHLLHFYSSSKLIFQCNAIVSISWISVLCMLF